MLPWIVSALGLAAVGRAALTHPASPLGRPARREPAGVALTFDDGPDPDWTPRVLDALDAVDAKASFFVLGERVERHPEVVRACAARGHRVEVHGWRHRRATLQAPRDVARELARTCECVAALTRRRPRWYRPPYGARPLGTRCFRDQGLALVTWSWWCRDWAGGDALDAPFEPVSAGAIALLHDGPTPAPDARRRTLAALAHLARARCALVPLSDPYAT